MAKHRTHSIEFKRQVVQEFLGGEPSHALARRHGISRNLIKIWVAKYEAGGLDSDTAAADVLADYEARIARLVGKLALENEFLRGLAARSPAEKRQHVRCGRPPGLSIAEACRLMGLAAQTYYDEPESQRMVLNRPRWVLQRSELTA